MKFFLLSIIIFCSLKLISSDDSLRLPETSIPLHYDLLMSTEIHLGARNFNGNVKIDIEIKEETETITLHSRGLSIISLKLFDDEKIQIESIYSLNVEKEFLIILSTSRTFKTGEKFKIEIEFSGLMQLGTEGFYMSSYRTGDEQR
jgi:aminopeptidase N